MRSQLVKVHDEISSLSGAIEVWQDGWERKLIIGGATQSIFRLDGKDRGYWPHLVPQKSIDSALILGLGGGTVARILRRKWPQVKIVGIELDPVVVRVATSYFGLDPETEVRTQDFRAVFHQDETYDLVIVDLYLGRSFLPAAEEKIFLSQLRRKLNPGGLVAFNRIPTSGNKSELAIFEANLRAIFKEVWTLKADYNLIYWGRK